MYNRFLMNTLSITTNMQHSPHEHSNRQEFQTGMNLREQFGNRLRHLRQVEGMTQQNLAENASVTVEYVSKLERGLASPSFDVLARLCAALRIQPANLFLFSLHDGQPAPDSGRSSAEKQDAIGLDGFISGMAFWSRDIATDTYRFSSNMGSLFGYPPGSPPLAPQTLFEHFDGKEQKRLLEGKRLHDAGIRIQPMRMCLRRQDGSLRHCIVLADIDFDENNKPVMAHGAILDVTELMDLDRHLGRTHRILKERVRERTEHLHQTIRSLGEEVALRKRSVQEMAIYRQMVENSNDRMAFMDRDLIFRVVNEAVARFYDRPMQDLVGRSLIDVAVCSDTTKARLSKLLHQVLNGTPVRIQGWQQLPGREPIYLDVTLSPCRDEHGGIIGVVSLVRDLTDLKYDLTESDSSPKCNHPR